MSDPYPKGIPFSEDPFPDLNSDLKISCQVGFITISLRTGEITYENCDPSEAARAFWESVTLAFPSIRDQIKRS